MKLLLVHNFYRSHQVGGEDVVFNQERAALCARLGQESVISYTVSNDDLKSRRLLFEIWGNQKHTDNILKLAQQHQVDIVHAHNVFPLITPAFFLTLKKIGIPTILTLHNYRPWCLAGTLHRTAVGTCYACFDKKNFLPSLYHRCYRGSLPLSMMGGAALQWYQWQHAWEAVDRFFVLSEHQLTQLKQFGMDGEKLWLKPNFIETNHAVAASNTKQGFLYVGRLEPDKGIDWLLSQWQFVPESYVLTVIGTSPHGADYAKQYAKSNIIFKGSMSRQEVLLAMASARYLIHPSWMPETFGLTVLEAQSLGTPVIGLRCGPRIQFIKHGVTGWHYEKDTFQTILHEAAHFSGYESMSKAAVEHAAHYEPSGILDKQLAYYAQLSKIKKFS